MQSLIYNRSTPYPASTDYLSDIRPGIEIYDFTSFFVK